MLISLHLTFPFIPLSLPPDAGAFTGNHIFLRFMVISLEALWHAVGIKSHRDSK